MNYFFEAVFLKNHDDIVKEIRILTFHDQTENIQKKQELLLAARFKQLHSACDDINANDFLILLFDWLSEQPEHLATEIATAVWMHYLEKNIPDVRPHHFI